MEETIAMPRKLWEHSNPQSTLMYEFMQVVNQKNGLQLKTFWDLVTFSISPETRPTFWADLFAFSRLIHSGTYTRVVDTSLPIDAVPMWFEGVRLNFAENMLYSLSSASSPGSVGTKFKEDHKIAVTEVREGGTDVRNVTWAELRTRAGEVAAAMKARGIKRGDRVVIVGANSVETLLVWLGTAWLGAVFSSSSTDMGVAGILQRTVQVEPSLVFFDDAAVYNGKFVDLREKLADVVKGLKSGMRFGGCVVIPRFEGKPLDIKGLSADTESWGDFLKKGHKAGSERKQSWQVPEFERIPFGDPFLICYSSGTTGMPKAIVHSVGGLMLNYFKEGVLHEGLGPGSVTLQFTTVGWVMYVANVGPLMFGARAVMYDGSPFKPDPGVLVRLMGREKVTKLGTSPRWMLEIAKAGLVPRDMADLKSLRVVTCTGSVLSEELQAWFYDVGFPKGVQLGNISGGTDIAGCFGCLNPLIPVYIGGAQGPSLGVDARIYDALLPNGPGKEVPAGTPGELVAVQSFPNMPPFFWNDGGDDNPSSKNRPGLGPGPRYHSAYFERFDHVWAHGDFCAIHPLTRQIAFLGRADGVLNPSGVRFGSAEVYSVLERRFADRVADSLCVGQRRPGRDHDETVILFLLMRPGMSFTRVLVREVKEAIAGDLSKRHVPKYVFETPEIPTTVNLKKVELPVKQIVCGQKIKASGTLANPQSLDYYYRFVNVEELVDPEEKL